MAGAYSSAYSSAYSPTIDSGGPVEIGIAGDTSSAFSVTASKSASINQSAETDIVQAINALKATQLLQALESDSIFNISAKKSILIDQTLEINTAFALTLLNIIPINLITENDTSQSITASKIKAISQVTESDISQQISAGIVKIVGLTNELNLSQLISKSKIKEIGRITESDLSQGITAGQAIAINIVNEINNTFSIEKLKEKEINQALESDSVFNIVLPKDVQINFVSETDQAMIISVIFSDVTLTPADLEAIATVVFNKFIAENYAESITNAVWGDIIERAEETKGGLVDHLRHLQYSLVFNQAYDPAVGETPDGSQHRPFNDVAEVIDYAELHKIKNIFLYSELILPVGQNIKNFIFTGIGLQKVVVEGQDLSKSEFNHIELEGQYLGRIIAESCYLSGTNTTINGEFGNCTFGSDFEVPNNGSALIQHSSSIADGFVKPTFSIGGVAGTARLEFANHVGGITILNCNQPTDDVKIIANSIVELDSSCIDGEIVILGNVKPIDNSGPGCTVHWFNINPDEVHDIAEMLGLSKGNPIKLGNGKHLSNNIDVTTTDNGDGTFTLDRQ